MRSACANVASDLQASALRKPDKTVVVRADGTGVVSYAELAAVVDRIALFLRRHGVGVGDRVALMQSNSAHHIASWYAILHCGAICVDLNIALSPEQWAGMLNDCLPSGILTDARHTDKATSAAELSKSPVPVWRTESIASVSASQPVAGPEPVSPQDVAIIAYTSGTTGLPKGVMHTHVGVAAELDLLVESCGFAADWTSYVAIPLFSMHGYLPQVAVFCRVGGTIVLADKFDAQEFAAASRRHRISYTTLSSPMLPSLTSLPADERPDLRWIEVLSCGGSPLHPDYRADIEHKLGVALTEGYGLTEVLGAFVMNLDQSAPYGSSGRVYPSGPTPTLRIQDDAGAPVPVGEPGEIAFHHSKVLLGYWPDVSWSEGSEWFATGDIGKLDASGYLYLLDRKKDVILRGGFTIYPAEIERVLAEDPDVLEATVIGAADERLGEVPVAFVVLNESANRGGQDARLQELVRLRLGPLKALAHVELAKFEDLPRNALNKVIKRDLRERMFGGETHRPSPVAVT